MKKRPCEFLRKNWQIIVPIVISFVALGYSIFNGCQADQRFERQHYLDLGFQYRPNIVLADTPSLMPYKFIFQPGIGEEKISMDTAEIEAVVGVELNFKFVNKGNTTAKILGYVFADTVYGGSFLREFLMDNKKIKMIGIQIKDNEFYKTTEILPSERKTISLRTNIIAPTDNVITLHFLLLYYNEYMVLFDSYFWIRYDIHSFLMKNNGFDELGQPIIMVANKDLYSFFKYRDENFSSFVYSYDEKLKLENNLKQIEK